MNTASGPEEMFFSVLSLLPHSNGDEGRDFFCLSPEPGVDGVAAWLVDGALDWHSGDLRLIAVSAIESLCDPGQSLSLCACFPSHPLCVSSLQMGQGLSYPGGLYSV